MKKIYVYLFILICCATIIIVLFNRLIKQSAPQTIHTITASVSEEPVQASSRLKEVNYHVSYADKTIHGVLTVPTNYMHQKLPVVIIAHGFNNTLEMYASYAKHLADLGFIVYRFDFFGGSHQSKSGGNNMLNMSVKTQKEDLEAVITQLSTETFIDTHNINLLGVSQGGVVTSLVAADYKDKINKMILIFPAFVLFDDVQQTYQSLNVPSPTAIPDIITHRNNQLGRIYLSDALAINITAEQAQIITPTLIIHGTHDAVVPYQYALSAAQHIPNAQLVTVENGGHWIDNHFNQTALPAISNFLNTKKP